MWYIYPSFHKETGMHFDLQVFWLCFVPLFVAVDFLGTMPIFISLVGQSESKRVN
jgi:small neutral amino acid transporter SnatA (MarC family)